MKKIKKYKNTKCTVVLCDWMNSRLQLSGDELIVYAIIHGFSQDGEGKFFGSREYIARWIGKSKQTAGRVLKRLTDIGLLQKKVIYSDRNKVNMICQYWTTFSRYPEDTFDVAVNNWGKYRDLNLKSQVGEKIT